MLIKHRRGWEIPERVATPEHIALDRRAVIRAAGSAVGAILLPGRAAANVPDADPTADLYPARRNAKWTIERPLTPEDINGKYNNFYEFGSHKSIFMAAQRLKTRPWTVKIDGLVGKEQTLGIDDLIRRMPLEERLYRHRCVEAWSMTVPWTGFALAELVKLAEPTSAAKYVRMETFLDPAVASGQRQTWYPWPYVEGLTIEEAMNELAFMVTGAYGKPLVKQLGAPLRLHLPWKYGFKSIKSMTRISFVVERPKSFWEAIQPAEYGFWANVNPAVDHPRWSQASERVLGTDERIPTVLYNGYGEWVAHLYQDRPGERLFY